MSTHPHPLETMIGHIAARQGWAWRPDPGGALLVELPLAGGRTQVVRLGRLLDPEQEELFEVSSVAGEAAAVRDPFALLAYSAGLGYGAVVLRAGQVLVRQTLRPSGADDPTITKTIFHVGRTADLLESEAYGPQDRN